MPKLSYEELLEQIFHSPIINSLDLSDTSSSCLTAQEKESLFTELMRRKGEDKPLVLYGLNLSGVDFVKYENLEDELSGILLNYREITSLDLSCCVGIGFRHNAIAGVLSTMKNLQFLDLSYLDASVAKRPPITRVIQEMQNRSRLEILILAGNVINEDAANALIDLIANSPNLRYLDLSSCVIKTDMAPVMKAIADKYINGERQLKILNLSHNQISGRELEFLFPAIPGLQELYLSDNLIDGYGVGALAYLMSDAHCLRILDLKNNPTNVSRDLLYLFDECAKDSKDIHLPPYATRIPSDQALCDVARLIKRNRLIVDIQLTRAMEGGSGTLLRGIVHGGQPSFFVRKDVSMDTLFRTLDFARHPAPR